MKTIHILTSEAEVANNINHRFINYKIVLLITSLLFLLYNANAQLSLADVEFDKIEKETVEAYLQEQINSDIETFTEIKPSLQSNSSTEGFQFHERKYIVKDSLDKVWSHYVSTNPAKAWNTSKLDFGFMFSKKANEMVYPNQHVDKVETGQVIYLNLLLLKIKNLAMAFEIITMDEDNRVMEFSYIDDNITHGKQQLNFEQTPEGYTKIVHRSYFKSKSKVRDRYFYPYFHTRLTNSYHKNMKKLYTKE